MHEEQRPLQDPVNRITPRAIRAWQWTAGLANLIYFAPPIFFLISVNPESAYYYPVFLLLITGSLAVWVAGICWLPYLRWKRWRYSVDRDEIDLKRGILVRRRTLIPLNRVQHVDTRQGPILRYYGLAAVTISTAATTHEIPVLDEVTADQVRDRISRYARLADEDV